MHQPGILIPQTGGAFDAANNSKEIISNEQPVNESGGFVNEHTQRGWDSYPVEPDQNTCSA